MCVVIKIWVTLNIFQASLLFIFLYLENSSQNTCRLQNIPTSWNIGVIITFSLHPTKLIDIQSLISWWFMIDWNTLPGGIPAIFVYWFIIMHIKLYEVISAINYLYFCWLSVCCLVTWGLYKRTP